MTGTADAVGLSARLTIKPSSVDAIIETAVLEIARLGLVAGNKQEYKLQLQRRLSSTLNATLEALYREPIIGPLPLVYEGTAANPGPAIFIPRGAESPFWVNWSNRTAEIITITCTYDPTPKTWFYLYRDGILDEWNLNPREDAPYSFAAQWVFSRYPGGTDRLLYYNENGAMTWESISAGAWPINQYLGTFSLLNRFRFKQWDICADIGVGESPALGSMGYTTDTAVSKPITGYGALGLRAVYRNEYTAQLRYTQNAWGPEDWHRTFGESYDQLIQGSLSKQFGDDIKAGVEYTNLQENDYEYIAPSLGTYEEARFFLSVSFGPVVPFFGPGKPPEAKKTAVPVKKSAKDVTPPTVVLALSAQKFSPDGDNKDDVLIMRPQAEDLSGIDNWQLEIRNASNKAVKLLYGKSTPPSTILWDGKDDVYMTIVPNGRYTLTFTATDRAFNSKTISQLITVERGQYQENTSMSNDALLLGLRETPGVNAVEIAEKITVSLNSTLLFTQRGNALRPESKKTLDALAIIAKKYPKNKVDVEGHTDSTGTLQKNNEISEQRAQYVADYLIMSGVSMQRVKVTGYGPSKPKASNATIQGREANRRVEVLIYK